MNSSNSFNLILLRTLSCSAFVVMKYQPTLIQRLFFPCFIPDAASVVRDLPAGHARADGYRPKLPGGMRLQRR